MKALLEQLPVLLGVGLGALATMITTALNDRRQWKHAQAVRWDDRRFVAYTDYARAVKDFYRVTVRLAASRGQSEADRALLGAAREKRTQAWESVLLLGDATTVAAAREWRVAVAETERIAVAGGVDDDEWAAAVQAVNHSRDGFYVAARASLAVGGGPVAQAAWLRTDAPWRQGS